jgi:hypothetical protein
MRVFIAGVMQGSRADDQMSDQGYRTVITEILQNHADGIEIIDPWALHPDSDRYDLALARETFLSMSALAGQVDVLVAYVPEASMGTAIEIWEAHRNGAKIFTISHLTENWVVKLLSTEVFADLAGFEYFVQNGGLAGAV